MNKYNYKDDAKQYDEQATDYGSYSHNVVFGMCHEYVKPEEKLLDLGIGTGLSSIQFSKSGLKIYGLDDSEEMLHECRSKQFTEELTIHDLNKKEYPYDENYFDHVICCGVFHFIQDLDTIFSETSRIIKHGGTFSFMFSPNNKVKNYSVEMTSWRVPIYKHSMSYIEELAKTHNVEVLKEQRLLMKGKDKRNYDMIFSVVISRFI